MKNEIEVCTIRFHARIYRVELPFVLINILFNRIMNYELLFRKNAI